MQLFALICADGSANCTAELRQVTIACMRFAKRHNAENGRTNFAWQLVLSKTSVILSHIFTQKGFTKRPNCCKMK